VIGAGRTNAHLLIAVHYVRGEDGRRETSEERALTCDRRAAAFLEHFDAPLTVHRSRICSCSELFLERRSKEQVQHAALTVALAYGDVDEGTYPGEDDDVLACVDCCARLERLLVRDGRRCGLGEILGRAGDVMALPIG